MIKATTQHGTYYLIDLNGGKAKRVKGEGRNTMYGDEEWFYFGYLRSYDFDTQEFCEGIEIDKALYFSHLNNSVYDWRSSTRVVSIEEYDE